MGRGLHEGRDATIDLDAQRGEVGFQSIHVIIAEWWYGAVFPWTQAMEYGLTGMHDDAVAPGSGHDTHEVGHIFVAVQVIDADTVLHRDWQGCRLPHGLDTARDDLGLGHEAGAEMAVLDAATGAGRCAACAAILGSQHGQSVRHMADRTASPRQASEAVPLAAAGPGYHAEGTPGRAGWPWSSGDKEFLRESVYNGAPHLQHGRKRHGLRLEL